MSDLPVARTTGLAALFFAVSVGIGVVAVTRDPGIGAEVLALFSDRIVSQRLRSLALRKGRSMPIFSSSSCWKYMPDKG